MAIDPNVLLAQLDEGGQDFSGRSFREKLIRELGLSARHVVEGVAGLGDIVNGPIDLLLEKTGVPVSIGSLHGFANKVLNEAGLPVVENNLEAIVGDISRAITGGAVFMGAGAAMAPAAASSAVPTTVSRVGEILQASPKQQLTSMVSGSGASIAAREAGVGPMGQVAAGVAGAATPGGLQSIGSSATRAAFRGTDPARTQQNLETFGAVGMKPTAGQASQTRRTQGAETTISRMPGGAGPMARKAEQQAKDFGNTIIQKALELSPDSNPTLTGLNIERGISGKGGFIETAKAKAKANYDKVAQFVDGDTPVALNNTSQVLKDLTTPAPAAPETSALVMSQSLRKVRTALENDLAAISNIINPTTGKGFTGPTAGTMPYESARKLRSFIGDKITNRNLIDELPIAELKRIYATLSDDIFSAVEATGNPQAVSAARRADNYWKSFIKRTELIDRVINKAGGGEKIWKAVTSGTKEGATTLRGVMQSVPTKVKRQLTASIVQKMGRSTSGQQNVDATVFSIHKFLTEWNNLSEPARRILFGSHVGPNFNKDMKAIANVSLNIREGAKVFANPPGTAAATNLQLTVGGSVIAAFMGEFGAASAMLGSVAASNLASRLLTNPRFVGWLANSTKLPPSAFSAQVGVLASIANREKDEDLAIAAAMLSREPLDIMITRGSQDTQDSLNE
jgi:hypothetical protein